MKRFLLVIALFLITAAASQAQYAYPTEITSRGSKILVQGEKLTPDQATAMFTMVGGAEMGQDYLSYRKGYKVGVGLSVGGASMTVVGSATFLTGLIAGLVINLPASIAGEEPPVWPDVLIYAGGGAAVSGAAMMLAGIPTACVYRHRIKKVTAEYNSTVTSSKPVVTFSPARSGIGIAMNF